MLLVVVALAPLLLLNGCAGLVSDSSSTNPPPSTLSITNVRTASTTTSTSQIVWTTNVPADSAVAYGTTSSYGTSTPVDSTMVTSHQVSLSGLSAGTTYYYQVSSTDSKSNRAKGPGKFKTPGFSISGTISPSAGGSGATLTLTGAASTTTTADNSGNYVFAGLPNGTYGVAPNHVGYTFSPSSQSTTVNGANVTGVNFTANPVSVPPSITSLNPASGPVGTSVTITGTNFGSTQGTSTVKFNGTTATPTSWSATSIAVPVPSGATTGNVVVTVGGVASNGVTFTVMVPPPSITSLNPASGSVGTSVTITGTNFGSTQGTSTVKFNGTAATPTSWTASSITAPVPTGAATGNVVVTVGGVASNGVNFTVTTGTVSLPIKVSSNGRYLVDQNNVPRFMLLDAGHHIVCALAQSNWNTYFADRHAKGYTATDLFSTYASGNCPASGAAKDGTLPFTTGNSPSTYDLATPNNAFWSEIDTLLTDAENNGLMVVFNPLITQNFLVTFQNAGNTKCFNWGVYLGNRYKNFANIIWYNGNDFQSWQTASNLALVNNIMSGIKTVDTNHLQSIQLNYQRSYSNQAAGTLASNLTLDAVYTYYEVYDYVGQAYASSPTLPVFLLESNYEGGNNTGQLSSPANAFILRQEAYYAVTSGAAGTIWGNESVNHFDTNYPGSLTTTATLEAKYLPQLLAPYAWWNLVPDTGHVVVTSGYGTAAPNNLNMYNATYATTAWITDGSLAITYTPVATTLTVNMANFSKPMTASWYDPTTGNSTVIVGSPFPNSGSQSFTTLSTVHSDGTHDWVLVLH